MVPLSPRVADVRELDNGDGVGQGYLPAAAGDRLFLRPVIPGNGTCQFLTLSAKLFLQRLQLIPPDLLLNQSCTITQSAAYLTLSANSFRKTLFAKLFSQTA